MALRFDRYKTTEKVISDGKITYGAWNEPALLSRSYTDNEIIYYAVDSGMAGRPDNIAYQIYGTVELGWFVIAFNAPRDPLNWPQSGSTIKLPSPNIVLANL